MVRDDNPALQREANGAYLDKKYGQVPAPKDGPRGGEWPVAVAVNVWFDFMERRPKFVAARERLRARRQQS